MQAVLPVLLTDSYKQSHKRQYPEGTTLIYSNMTPRSSRVSCVDKVVFFGLQYFIKEYLIRQFNENFFNLPKKEVIRRFNRTLTNHLGSCDSTHIEQLHDLGYLPICIKALPEGTETPLKVPMVVLYNTHPDFFWFTNSIESILSNILWMPCTSATTALRYRRVFESFAEKTGADKSFIPFQGHDFSFRGMTSLESACTSGSAHLLSFLGTDTIPALDLLENYYGANQDSDLIGLSVCASEHSTQTLCALNETETPDDAIYLDRMLDIYPSGIFSIVADGFDFWKFMTDVLPSRKDRIMSRDGKVVTRPDSGDPVKIICGDPDSTIECVRKGAIETLWDTFGGTLTDKGYKVLDSHVGLIYGDSITPERQVEILSKLEQKGFASSNVVLGVGSFTYQYVTRDTYGFAMKATFAVVNGKQIEIYKDPKTDDGTKKSARGLLRVNSDFTLTDRVSWSEEGGLLEPVFLDGKLVKDQSLSEIRTRINDIV